MKKYKMKKKFKISLIFLAFILIGVCVLCIYFIDNDKIDLNTPNLKKDYYIIKKFELASKHLYMALDDSKKINYSLEVDSNYNENITFSSSDPEIVSVDKDGVVKSLKEGNATISVKLKDEERTLPVTVTNMIDKMTEKIAKKNKLICNKYSEEDNDLYDDILENRVNEAGYLTRAGAVAAARFLTLEFPYKIHYFSENGRLNTYGRTFIADAEGRYYHKGLYLHKSRFENINKEYIRYGPVVWGCDLYSYVNDFMGHNGFDCSGFITWVLVQAGFDPGDIGSGITDIKDMTDLGPKIPMSEALETGKIKVGDLLSGASITGGHIAILAGIKDGHYYVAESLWHTYKNGVLMEEYTKDNFEEYFKWVVDMEEYYKEDGNLTDYWM